MVVANHEFAQVIAPSGITTHAASGYALWQTATVTTRVNTEQVSAIGYKGVVAITSLLGTVDVSLNGYIRESQGLGKALTDPDLWIENDLGQITIQTRDPQDDPNDPGNEVGGPKAVITGVYLTSLNLTFRAQAAMETTFNFACDSVDWQASDVDLEPIDLGVNTLDLPSFWSVVVSGTNVNIYDATSVTFDATLNRNEVYILGQKTPVDRPVEHPFDVRVTVETLAGRADLANKFVTDYIWDRTGYTVRVSPSGGGNDYAAASGLRPTDGGINISVGANSTSTLTFSGWDMSL